MNIEQIKQILDGIDQTEMDSPEGWWETTEGAEFGKAKLAEIIALANADEKKPPE